MAVLHAEADRRASPRLGGLVFGLVDFAGDIGAQETGAEQFFYYNYAKAKTTDGGARGGHHGGGWRDAGDSRSGGMPA